MSNRQEGNEAIVRNDEEAVQPKRRALTRQDFLKITAGVAGVGVGAVGLTINTQPANAQKATKLDPLTLSCVEDTDHTIFLKVKAGATGAPAGFSLHWVKHSDYPALTCGASGESQKSLWPSTGDCDATTTPNNCNVCSASFSGVPGCSNYNLGPNAEIILEVGNLKDGVCGVSLHNCAGDELECGTEYIFRAFAHNAPGGLNKSDLSNQACCPTEACPAQGGCTFTQGYWKTHPCEWPAPFVPGISDPVNPPVGQCALTSNPNEQCACDATNTIMIGSVSYNQCQLLCVLDKPGGGNALVILAHQLIAAELNLRRGAPAPTCDMPAAHALIGTRNILTDSVPTGGKGNTLGPAMTAAALCLDLYNNGEDSAVHCP